MKIFTKRCIALFLLFISVNTIYSDWVQQISPVTSDLFGAWAVNSDICWMSGPLGIVIKTTNGGINWNMANNGLSNTLGFYTLSAIDANKCWIGADDGTLWKTINGGVNWVNVTLNPVNPFVDAVHFFDANTGFVLGDPSSGIWRFYITTNGGTTWSLGDNSPPAAGNEASYVNTYCALDTGHIWWGTNNTRIYKGSLRGPFTGVPTPGAVNTFGIAFNNPLTGVATMANSVYTVLPHMYSSDGGTNWASGTYIPSGLQYGMKGIPGTSYIWMTGAGIFSGYIYRSTDNGNWFDVQFTTPPGNAGGCISMVNVNCGWVGTISTAANEPGGKIYKYSDNVGITNYKNGIPSSFKLEQNYPNPFNPTTRIQFNIETPPPPFNKWGIVSLKIFNILGKEVAALLNKSLKPGTYKVEWNASAYSSGVYFYSLFTDGILIDTKKMVLIR